MNDQPSASRLIAKTLELEFGRARYLQIGLFEKNAADVNVDLLPAQQRFNVLLQQSVTGLCAAQGKVLLAGAALGQLALELANSGLHSCWLKHHSELNLGIELEAKSGSSLEIIEESLLEFESAQHYECIVVAGSYRYLDQLAILSHCRELLAEDGYLLLFGEFLQDDSEIGPSTLANISSLQQLSVRLGFQLNKREDLSSSALQSVRMFNELLSKHRHQLSIDLQLDNSELTDICQNYLTMQAELESGRRSFNVWSWQLPNASGNASLGEYAAAAYGDINSFGIMEIANLFEKSFDKAFDPALWHWKYVLGGGKCVVARIEKQGDIVAHYGGAPRKIRYFGNPSMAIQVCDVMVLPEKRRQYGKSSLFFKVAATFLEREIGNSVKHLLGFGFPNQKAMNIATRLGLYEKTDDFVEVSFEQTMAESDDLHSMAMDFTDRQQQQQLEDLWQAMAAGFESGIIGERDHNYLKYRYCDHPRAAEGQFQCLLLQAPTEPGAVAFAVLKKHGEFQLLMDLVCPPSRMPLIISKLNQIVKENNPGQHLRMWLTRSCLQTIMVEGCIVNKLGIEIPCNSWNPGPSAATLYGKWWLTAGDMDFM